MVSQGLRLRSSLNCEKECTLDRCCFRHCSISTRLICVHARVLVGYAESAGDAVFVKLQLEKASQCTVSLSVLLARDLTFGIHIARTCSHYTEHPVVEVHNASNEKVSWQFALHT
jgi:hypothetical protein